MLDLPSSCTSCGVGAVVEEVLRQAGALGRYPDAAIALTGAALEFMLAGPRWANRPDRPELRRVATGWRMETWVIYVLPGLDDEALAGLADTPLRRGEVEVIAPPGTATVIRHAINVMIPRKRVTTYAIDAYIELRVALTSMDARAKFSAAVPDLLQRYGRLVAKTPELAIQSMAKE